MGVSKWPDGRISSDWYAVAGLMQEMCQTLGSSIVMEVSAAGSVERPDLLLRLTSVPMEGNSAGDVPSASVSCLASRARMENLKGLCFFLLYQLDFVSVSKEVGKEDTA